MRPFRLEVPNRAEYPYHEILAGMEALGYEPSAASDLNASGAPLVTWSPWLSSIRDGVCKIWSGPIIVMENGWLQPIADRRYWSVCLWGWNGTGVWHAAEDDGARFVEQTEPFRELIPHYGRSHRNPRGPIVVVEQRGHDADVRTSPKDWAKHAYGWLAPKASAIFRAKEDPLPIHEYLVHWKPSGVFTWSSAVASWALLLEIPVCYAGPSIWCWELATRWDGAQLPRFEMSLPSKRRAVFHRLAWSQWNKDELSSGEPFRRLLTPI